MRAKEFLIEYNREITLQKLGSTIDPIAKRERLTVDQVIDALEQIDPTANKQYIPWLARQYIKGQFRTEDSNRVREIMVNFGKLKTRLPVEQRDINRMDFYKLDELIDNLLNPELANKLVKQSAKQSELNTFPEVPDSMVLYNGPFGQLAKPETKKASCELGRGTTWCTAATIDNRFSGYDEAGELYIWRDKKGEKYQFFFPFDDDDGYQFMDSDNHPIDHKLLTNFRTQHPVLKKFFSQKEREIAKDPRAAYDYAKEVIRGRCSEAELTIAKNPQLAYRYAKEIIGGRWPEAEPTIAKNPQSTLDYAKEIIGGRWHEAEPTIAKDAGSAQLYAQHVIQGRWPEAEPTIAKDAGSAQLYARHVIQGRWPEAEPTIAKDAWSAQLYARHVIQGRWPEAEPTIAKSAASAYYYAEGVIGGRWIPGEAAMSYSNNFWPLYKEFLSRQLKKDI